MTLEESVKSLHRQRHILTIAMQRIRVCQDHDAARKLATRAILAVCEEDSPPVDIPSGTFAGGKTAAEWAEHFAQQKAGATQ